ncbi:MAG: SAM-dependent methyltransferase [Treponema sp.]
MKETKRGAIAFDAYYSSIFGSRWLSLREALLLPSSPTPYIENLKQPYYMDEASIAVGKALPALDEGLVLDMCAAPGGKTLVLSNSLGKNTSIQANEISRTRRNRLIAVIEEHLSDEKQKQVKITGYDAAKMARFAPSKYDRILLDAPCSSERHVINLEKAINEWTPARPKQLAIRQWSLLSSAFLMLKEGGFLVYSTCALLELENDCVIDRLLKKYINAVVLHEIPSILKEQPEATRHGFMYSPDLNNGIGPMYFCLVKKNSVPIP